MSSIYTRKTMGFDKRVWFVMLASIVLPLILLSYRLIDKHECLPVDYTFKSESQSSGNGLIAGETVFFKARSNTNDITWDFGDESEKGYGRYVMHKFSEGKYFVKASTGSGCEQIKQVVIKKPVRGTEIASSDYIVGEEIVGPTATITGKEELFTCMVSADSYEWSILNYPKMVQTGSSVKFTFPRYGKYVVQVTLDHDRTKRYIKEILVETEEVEQQITAKNQYPEKIDPLIPIHKTETPAAKEDKKAEDEPVITPPKVEPAKRKTMFISNETFFSFLESVLNNQKDINDFNQYLVSEGATKVQVNGETGFKTFAWLYQELKGKNKKYKLKTVVLVRDESENVFNIKVEYKKRGLLDRVF